MKNTVYLSLTLGLCSLPSCAQAPTPLTAPSAEAAAYFAEPKISYDEEILDSKQEEGWKWTEFRYTSLVFEGQPIRVHAVYGVPDGVSATNKVPAILMTHGVFGAIKGPDARYWGAFSQLVKAGYAVLFFDWYPDYAKNAKPDAPKNYTTFGNIDYFGTENWFRKGQDFKESLHYQVVMAGKRGLSWLEAKPEVDTSKIGVTGASYGGIFSSMLAGNDTRIKAASLTIYTAGFGRNNDAYNMLPANWTDAEMELWRSRFDSKVLLAKRNIPILYQVGSSDSTFLMSKAMDTFGALNEPKFLNIGLNKGHEFWGFDQTILFFDSALKGKFPRLSPQKASLKIEGREAVASFATPDKKPVQVEVAFAPAYEIDPLLGAAAIPANAWKWTTVTAQATPNGGYSGRFTLPTMRMAPTGQFYDWGEEDNFKPTAPTSLSPADDAGLIRALGVVTDQFGAVDVTPLTLPVAFHDEKVMAPLTAQAAQGPVFLGGTKIKTLTPIKVTSEVAAGVPRAVFDADLPQKEVGKSGYVLWNWRQQQADSGLQTEGTRTPTKLILPPFKDSIGKDSFRSALTQGVNPWGGYSAFSINGKENVLLQNRAHHGSIPVGVGGAEEVTLEPTDEKEHLLTLVMAGVAVDECMARVTVRDSQGHAAIVRYKCSAKADNLFQFRVKGKVTLGAQITSQPTRQFNVVVGPSALFLD